MTIRDLLAKKAQGEEELLSIRENILPELTEKLKKIESEAQAAAAAGDAVKYKKAAKAAEGIREDIGFYEARLLNANNGLAGVDIEEIYTICQAERTRLDNERDKAHGEYKKACLTVKETYKKYADAVENINQLQAEYKAQLPEIVGPLFPWYELRQSGTPTAVLENMIIKAIAEAEIWG